MRYNFFAGCRLVELSDKAEGGLFPMVVLYPTLEPEKTEEVETLKLSLSMNASVEKGELPLVLISHGSGGSPWFYRTLALHLARNGFVVGMPEHPRDNRRDSSLAGTLENLANRPRHMQIALDWFCGGEFSSVLRSGAVGLIGHSTGGYTALAAAGGVPATLPGETEEPQLIDVKPDPRVRALVLLAPSTVRFGAEGSLKGVDVPILMVVGDKDTYTPYEHHARLLLDGVPDRKKVRCGVVKNAGHFSFMTPFPDPRLKTPPPAQDLSGFDQERFLRELNSEVLDFLSLTFLHSPF